MNILIIDNSIAFTGALKCALNEAELLSDEHNFTFVLHYHSTQAKLLKERGFTVHLLPLVEIRKSLPILLLYPIMLLRNTMVLRRIVKEENIDIVQVNDFYNLLGAMLKLAGYKGKLLTYVRFLPSVMPGFLRKIWIGQAIKHSHKVVAVSDAVKNQLPDEPNVIRVYDPVQLSEELPEKQHSNNETIEILYLSNYIKGKGQEHALEAFAAAYKKLPTIRLTYMGGDMGLEKNKEFRAALQQRTKELGLEDVITFAAFNANVEEAIKKADIMLNFSEAESFSMTCLEAAYYGTALIATRCGGPEEIIDNGNTGITVPLKDREAMTQAIIKLSEDSELRRVYAEAGRKYVKNKFNIEQYKTAFSQVLSDK